MLNLYLENHLSKYEENKQAVYVRVNIIRLIHFIHIVLRPGALES